MIADFLPPSVAAIRDPDAIALLQQLQRRTIQLELGTTVSIATAHIHAGQRSTIPIVLLHGFDSSVLEFRRLFPDLTAHHEIWAIDLLGSGFTQAVPNLAVNSQTIRQHLFGVIQSWIARPVILVGASLGGAVAIDFTLHYPDWVQSLVLIDSVGFSGSVSIAQWLPRSLLEWGADWLQFRKQAALTAALTFPIANSMLIDALRCSLLHQEMPGWKEAIVSFSQSGGYADLATQIPKLQHSTLILWGTADDVLGTEDAARFAQSISNSRLVWIENAGHVPHFDQPRSVAAHLLSFIA